MWIVDPLDGTREYGEAGRHDWAVHVGAVVLRRADRRPRSPCRRSASSCVTDPASGPPRARPGRRAARRQPHPAARGRRAVAEALGAELVPLGSAGYKTVAVVRGEVDAYVHAGGQYQWDSAAPVAVARAAGLHTCRLDGSPLVYNGPIRGCPTWSSAGRSWPTDPGGGARWSIADTGRESASDRCGWPVPRSNLRSPPP